MKDTGCSKGSYEGAIKKFIEVGLIKKMPSKKWGPNCYKFVSDWHSYKSPVRDLLSGERVKKKSKKRMPQRNPETGRFEPNG